MTLDVMFVRPALERGGAEKMLAFVANTFAERDADNKTWLVTTHSPSIAYELHQGVAHVSLARPDSPRRHSKVVRYALALRDLRSLIRRLSPDLVAAFGVQYTLFCMVACLGLPAKVVGAERGSPSHLGPIWRGLTRMVYFVADGVVFQLPSVRDSYRTRAGRSVVIPNPYLATAPPAPPIPSMQRRPVIAGAFARWDDSKGVEVLLQAFEVVAGQYPELALQLIGPTEGADRYHRLARIMHLEDRVLFPGQVPDVAATVRDCRVFVLPSRHEGIPNVLLEVLGAGVPVVACDCPPGGPRLLSSDGMRALLVPVDDVEAMANAIRVIIDDDEVSDSLSRRALGVRAEFSPDAVRRSWIEFFARVVHQDETLEHLAESPQGTDRSDNSS